MFVYININALGSEQGRKRLGETWIHMHMYKPKRPHKGTFTYIQTHEHTSGSIQGNTIEYPCSGIAFLACPYYQL